MKAYSMHMIGEGWYRTEKIKDRRKLFFKNAPRKLMAFSLKLGDFDYDCYRKELTLSLIKPDKKTYFFRFYDLDSINEFLIELGVNNLDDLKILEGKISIEGFFYKEDLEWISAYDKRRRIRELEGIFKKKWSCAQSLLNSINMNKINPDYFELKKFKSYFNENFAEVFNLYLEYGHLTNKKQKGKKSYNGFLACSKAIKRIVNGRLETMEEREDFEGFEYFGRN